MYLKVHLIFYNYKELEKTKHQHKLLFNHVLHQHLITSMNVVGINFARQSDCGDNQWHASQNTGKII